MKRLLAALALLTLGATTPPSFTVLNTTITDADTFAMVEIDKSAKASSYSTITVTTIDDTAKAGVDYQAVTRTQTVANNTLAVRVPVPIIARPGYQGPRTFKLHLSVSRYGTVRVADATITINDSEQPPAPSVTWTKCADENGTCTISGTANVRYGSGSTWVTKSVTGSTGCNNGVFGDPLPGIVKECETDGTVAAPVPAPIPTPAPSGSWVAAPLTVGGYAWIKNGGACCNGLIVKIVDGGMTSDQNHPQHWWAYVYYADPSGNFPAKDPYWSTTWMYGFDDGLQGVS